MLIADVLPAYRAALVARGHRPSGVARYLDQLRAFARFLQPEATIDAITSVRIQRYREDMASRCSAGTVGNALTAIRSFCRWCLREEHVTGDPTVTLEWPRIRKPAPRALRQRELRALLEAIAVPEGQTQTQHWLWRRNRLAVLLMLYAGLRISEVAGLHWEDVDLDAAYLIVRDGKGGKDRTVPLHQRLVEELCVVKLGQGTEAVVGKPDGSSLHVKSLAHIFERWLPRHGVHISAHQLRHSFASELMRQGVNLRAIQELLGHERLETTQRYLLVDSEQLRAAVAAMPTNW